jgi:hypothetical protein
MVKGSAEEVYRKHIQALYKPYTSHGGRPKDERRKVGIAREENKKNGADFIHSVMLSGFSGGQPTPKLPTFDEQVNKHDQAAIDKQIFGIKRGIPTVIDLKVEDIQDI